jgi:hypothetical protein
MAKKKNAAKSTELDVKEFFAAISDIEKEKGIPKSYMLEKITQALVAAYKKDHHRQRGGGRQRGKGRGPDVRQEGRGGGRGQPPYGDQPGGRPEGPPQGPAGGCAAH